MMTEAEVWSPLAPPSALTQPLALPLIVSVAPVLYSFQPPVWSTDHLTVSVPFHSVFCVWETLSDIKQSWDD